MIPLRLLMVDDKPDIGAAVRAVAEGLGYEVQYVARASVFMEVFRSFDPDVVILDLAMPDTDGIELLRFLAKEKCRANVAIMSGFDTRVRDGARLLGEAHGLAMAEVISKPVRAAELREILNRLKPTPQ